MTFLMILLRIYRDLYSNIQRLAADIHGNFAVLTALIAVVLVGAAGGAIDLGRALNVRADLQESLDAAVLAAAREPQAQRLAEAQTFFRAGVSSLGEYAPTATFVIGADGTVSGEATASLKTSLLAVLNFDQLPVSVQSAAVGSAGNPATDGTPCILLLNGDQNALYVNSGAGIHKTDCEIHVHSTASPSATFTDGGNGLQVARICIKGPQVAYNNQLNPKVERGCNVSPDTLGSAMPSVSSLGCDSQMGGHLPDNKIVHKLSPGIYCNGLSANGSPTIEFSPGLYIIKSGDWFFNSGTTLIGTDVTLYFADTSSMHFNGNVNIDLSAPRAGTYKDILIFEQHGLAKTDWLFDGNQNATLNGIIYLPSRNIHFNSTFAMNNDRAAIVLDKMSLDGTNWDIKPLNGAGGTQTSVARGLRLTR
ncbi:pilus assembly protein (plasmid) [Rhizobium sp. CB3090]|uniref:TadE/TadG family type IV pilus assembly protein n=1 Tax=Rhizobium sp. CB3090 TaxID=3039156 RepID=UPI0024B102CF|nr:TadE/TadG family type IV pilus assembly protein [Rhizobium sp. CB3090]WFU12913.1 pilus assembly protein [Rhizobium sp. CB3090]